MVTKETSVRELLNIALTEIDNLTAGESFMTKDLFRGFEWNRIEIGKRIKLGSLFLLYAEDEGAKKIVATEKTAQNQQKYKKLEG